MVAMSLRQIPYKHECHSIRNILEQDVQDVAPQDDLALLRGQVHVRVLVQDAHPPPH